MDKPGAYSWITLEMMHKIKDARQGNIIKTQDGGDYWYSFHAYIYDFRNSKNVKFPPTFYGRKTIHGKPTAVEITLMIVRKLVGRVMADIGLHAMEYELASSPSESLIARPPSQFPWTLLDKLNL